MHELYYTDGVARPMNNPEKLLESMRPGRVYRRAELSRVTTAVDRDLAILVSRGAARRLAGGLYCRAGAPPEDRELARAFLKTEDFVVAGGDPRVVLNRKRSGEFVLGGRRFKFRLVRAYPEAAGGESLVRDRGPIRLVAREDERADLAYWLQRPQAERVAAVELLREQYYAMAGYKCLPRLERSIRLRGLHE